MKYAITPTRIRLVKRLLDETRKHGEALKSFHIPGAGSVTIQGTAPEPAENAETANEAAE